MRDGQIRSVKLIEIRHADISYKLFSYQDGPQFTISKFEVQKIKYQNGIEEIIPTKTSPLKQPITVGDSGISNTYIQKPERKIGDYIKFNTQVGLVLYPQFSNIQKHLDIGVSHSEEYNPVNSEKKNVAPYVGLGLVFGPSPYFKQIFNVNYIYTNTQYNYYAGSIGHSIQYKAAAANSILNILTGPRFTLFKRIHLEPLIGFTFSSSKVSKTGYSVNYDTSYAPDSLKSPPQYTYFEKQKDHEQYFGMLFCPRMSIDILKNSHRLEVFTSYSMVFGYLTRNTTIGVTYYPFKKLR